MKKVYVLVLWFLYTSNWKKNSKKCNFSDAKALPYAFPLSEIGSILSSLCIKARIVFWSHPITFAKCTRYDNVLLHYLLYCSFLDSESTAILQTESILYKLYYLPTISRLEIKQCLSKMYFPNHINLCTSALGCIYFVI